MKITDLEIHDLKDALEDADCGKCGQRLGWSFNNSSENPDWTAHCCQQTYHILVRTVEIFRGSND